MSSGWKKDEPPETQWVRLPSKHDPHEAPAQPAPRRRYAPGPSSPEAPPDPNAPFAHHQRAPTQTVARRQRHEKRRWVLLLVALLLGALGIVGAMLVVENLVEEEQVVG